MLIDRSISSYRNVSAISFRNPMKPKNWVKTKPMSLKIKWYLSGAKTT